MSGEVDFSDLDDLDSAPVKAKSYIVSVNGRRAWLTGATYAH